MSFVAIFCMSNNQPFNMYFALNKVYPSVKTGEGEGLKIQNTFIQINAIQAKAKVWPKASMLGGPLFRRGSHMSVAP